MFEAGKKYIFSRSKYFDDVLKYTSLSQAEKHRELVNIFDGTVFIGLGEVKRELVKGDYTLTVWLEWCIDGEAELI